MNNWKKWLEEDNENVDIFFQKIKSKKSNFKNKNKYKENLNKYNDFKKRGFKNDRY